MRADIFFINRPNISLLARPCYFMRPIISMFIFYINEVQLINQAIAIREKTATRSFNLLLIVLGNGIGNIVEWYSFLAYSYLAVVISNLFFPETSVNQGLILTFLIFGAGFLARPFGAIIFGYLGDKIGRQKTLLISQILMAIPSLFICVLPTFAQIGNYAALLLTACRFVQGISIAGEYTTSLCYMAEVAPVNRRGLFVSIIPASTAFGILLSSITVFIFVSIMPNEALYTWGWRAIFFFGFMLSLLSVWIRTLLPETKVFLKVKSHRERESNTEILAHFLNRTNLKKMLITISLVVVYAYFYQLFYIWGPTFLVTSLHFKYKIALMLNCFAMLLFLLSIVIGGKLADLYTEKTVILLLLFILIVVFFPLFNIFLYHATFVLSFVILLVFSLLFGIFAGASSSLFSHTFHPEIRSTALSISYNIPYAIVGGLTPALLAVFVDKALISQISFLSILVAVFGFLITLCIQKR